MGERVLAGVQAVRGPGPSLSRVRSALGCMEPRSGFIVGGLRATVAPNVCLYVETCCNSI